MKNLKKDMLFSHIEEIKEIYLKSETSGKKLGEIYGVSEATMLRFLKTNNIKTKVKLPKGNKSKMWSGYEEISGDQFYQIKNTALKQKIEISLSIQDLWNIYVAQDRKCYYSKKPINFLDKTVGYCRIDNNFGYTKENLILVDKIVCIIQKRFNHKTFMCWCNKISNKDKTISYNNIVLFPRAKNATVRYGNITGIYWTHIKQHAQSRNLPFKISIEQAWNQYQQQNGCCNLTGEPIYFESKNKKRTVSLDRINNNLGYTINNIQWLHKDINMMKYTLDNQELINLCKLITKNFQESV